MIAAARRALRGAQGLLAGPPAGATVLAWHLVGGGTGGAVDLEPAAFREQLATAARTVPVLPLRELAARLRDGDETPSLALTFDDAYRNFAEHALPSLRELALPATLFVPVGFVDGTSPPPLAGAALPALSWPELRELAADPRLEIGAHGWRHQDLRQLRGEDLERELGGARRRLEDEIGRPVTSFCYPRALWDRRVERAVAAAYDLAVVGGGRRLTPRSFRPTRLWRTSLTRATGPDLRPVLGARVWLDEMAADLWRRHGGRRRRSARA